MIKKYLDLEIKTVDPEEGSFEVIASSGKVDRMGDSINPEGWYLQNYKKNPVILWSHSTGGLCSAAVPPVGKADKVWVENGKELRIKGRFADTPFAQELKTLVEGGFLNAVSVGFMPLVEDTKGIIDIEEKSYRRATENELEKGHYGKGDTFTKQELLELSWVSVPALPQALVTAKEMKLNLITKALENEIKETEIKETEEEEVKKEEVKEENTEEIKEEAIEEKPKEEIEEKIEAEEETKKTEKEIKESEEEIVEDANVKEGRVISNKNRKLIKDAVNALNVLLEATEPEDKVVDVELPDVELPKEFKKEIKIKTVVIQKVRKSETERLLILAGKAMENLLLKERQKQKVNKLF